MVITSVTESSSCETTIEALSTSVCMVASSKQAPEEELRQIRTRLDEIKNRIDDLRSKIRELQRMTRI